MRPTKDDIAHVYEFLQTAVLPIDTTLEKGPSALSDQLMECRRMQDRLSQYQLDVHRWFAAVKQAKRAAAAVVRLNRGNEAGLQAVKDSADLMELEGLYDDLVGLMASVSVTRQNLRSTDSDIRLAATLMGQQIQLGQVQPGQYKKPTPPPQKPVALEEETVDFQDLIGSRQQ